MQILDILPMELFPEKVALLLPRILYSRLVLQASPHGSLLLPPKYPRIYPGKGGQREQRLDSHVDCGVPCCQAPPGPCGQAVISVLHSSWVTRGEAWHTDHLEELMTSRRLTLDIGMEVIRTAIRATIMDEHLMHRFLISSPNKHWASKATQKKCQLYEKKKKSWYSSWYSRKSWIS